LGAADYESDARGEKHFFEKGKIKIILVKIEKNS